MMQRFKSAWLVLLVLALMIGTAASTRPAHAAGATYFANINYDYNRTSPIGDCANPNNTDCTPRDAIAAATSGFDTVQINMSYFILQNGALNLSHNVTIAGPGANALTISAGYFASGFTVNAGVTATISGLTLTQSAGPEIVNSGTLTVSNSVVTGGYANPSGGGIDNGGTLTVLGSTISDNQADFGGGIYSTGAVTVVNSTIANNSAETGGAGGIYNDGGTLTVINSTLTGNSGVAGGGGLYNNGTAKLTNTIVAGNTPDDVEGNTLATNSHNVIGGTPHLGSLGDNGGTTPTVALQTGSPAIGAGDSATCAAAPVSGVDQRGNSRPATGCDIGAYQSQGLAAPVPNAWIIGTTAASGGYAIEQYTGSGWTAVSGAAVHIALGPDGQPWVVNSGGLIYHMVNGAWQKQPGTASDIAVGADGSVWIITTTNYVGTNGQPTGDKTIAYWNGTGWTQVSGGAVDIAVGPDGQPWVVNHVGSIYHFVNGSWQGVAQPGTAHDIAVGANGAVWIIGATAAAGGYNIASWNGSGWTTVAGAAVNIAVGSDGQPWVVNSSNQIYHMVNGAWQLMPGTAREIAAQ